MIDPGSDRAVYRQLADLLRAEILSGAIGPGKFLPSEGRLQQEYEVSRDTVRKALRVLLDEGLIVTRSGTQATVREPEERERVRVPRGAELISRPATPDERADLGIERGGPAWVVVVTVGGKARPYPADRTLFTFA